MTKSNSFNLSHCFWSFTAGVVFALIICAGVTVWIHNAPIPFVNKVQQNEAAVDPSLLDGKTLDPNQKLYTDGQGIEQTTGSVATVELLASPATDPAAGGTVDTTQYWVQAGEFNQSADAESMRARIAFIGLDASISYRNENGKRLYRVRIGPFERAQQADEIKQSLADNAIQGRVLRLNN